MMATQENPVFRQNLPTRLLAVAAPIFFCGMAVMAAVAPFKHEEGGDRIRLIAAFSALTLLMTWLLFRSAILVYTVRAEGLELRRWRSIQLVPWKEITEIKWNRWLRFFTIRGSGGVISFTSTDGFPQPGQLLHLIHERSQCQLPSHLREAMYGHL